MDANGDRAYGWASDDYLKATEDHHERDIRRLVDERDRLDAEIARHRTALDPIVAERARRAARQYRREWGAERQTRLIQTALTAPPGTYHPDVVESLIVAFEEDYG